MIPRSRSERTRLRQVEAAMPAADARAEFGIRPSAISRSTSRRSISSSSGRLRGGGPGGRGGALFGGAFFGTAPSLRAGIEQSTPCEPKTEGYAGLWRSVV
jgi:hypothetical protein